MQDVHDHQDTYWHQVEQAVTRGTSSGYDEAIRLLNDLRKAASHFQVDQAFQERFSSWVQPHLRRPAFVRRLKDCEYTLPKV